MEIGKESHFLQCIAGQILCFVHNQDGPAEGELDGSKFDIVVLNAMFALYCADVVASPAEAKPLILEAIGS